MKNRLERLQARLSALGRCRVCNDRGVDGVRIEHIGPGEHRPPRDPSGCHHCGRVGEVTTLIINRTPLGYPPLPGEPGAQYAEDSAAHPSPSCTHP